MVFIWWCGPPLASGPARPGAKFIAVFARYIMRDKRNLPRSCRLTRAPFQLTTVFRHQLQDGFFIAAEHRASSFRRRGLRRSFGGKCIRRRGIDQHASEATLNGRIGVVFAQFDCGRHHQCPQIGAKCSRCDCHQNFLHWDNGPARDTFKLSGVQRSVECGNYERRTPPPGIPAASGTNGFAVHTARLVGQHNA